MISNGYSKVLYTLFSTFICLNHVIIKKEQSKLSKWIWSLLKKKNRKWVGKISIAMKLLDLIVNVNSKWNTGFYILNL